MKSEYCIRKINGSESNMPNIGIMENNVTKTFSIRFLANCSNSAKANARARPRLNFGEPPIKIWPTADVANAYVRSSVLTLLNFLTNELTALVPYL